MKDYYKIAKELGLDPKNTDFATLIDALIGKAVNAEVEREETLRQLQVSNKLIKTLRIEGSELIEGRDKLKAQIVRINRENERLHQLIDNPR